MESKNTTMFLRKKTLKQLRRFENAKRESNDSILSRVLKEAEGAL